MIQNGATFRLTLCGALVGSLYTGNMVALTNNLHFVSENYPIIHNVQINPNYMNSDYKLNKPLQSYQADMAVTTNILSFIYYSGL